MISLHDRPSPTEWLRTQPGSVAKNLGKCFRHSFETNSFSEPMAASRTDRGIASQCRHTSRWPVDAMRLACVIDRRQWNDSEPSLVELATVAHDSQVGRVTQYGEPVALQEARQ